jgi:hypothetical protein
MADTEIYRQGWSLDDVDWAAFDRAKVQPWMLAAIKAAALVEYNAPDYVSYLKRVFSDAEPGIIAMLEQWSREETQHGKALGRWAELADAEFKLEEAFERFRKGFRPAHFDTDDRASVRGSKRGEMIARCVVESGTSTYYTALVEACEEPVLKEIAGRIRADELRHYKLFYDTFHRQTEPDLPFWKKLAIALGRIRETDDDELSYAFYCANVAAEDAETRPYDRAAMSKAAFAVSVRLYRRHHIGRLASMVAKAVGAAPHGLLATLSALLVWQMMRLRGGFGGPRLVSAPADSA